MSSLRSGLPIVFIHKGYSWYLHYTLSQIKEINKNSDIFLLGSDGTGTFKGIYNIDISIYSHAAEELKKWYRHRSTNNKEIEEFCFERWFYIRELMKQYRLDKIFTCDTDVMVYADVTIEDWNFGQYYAAFCIPEKQNDYRLSASAHVSYWTFKAIDDFCEFIIKVYSSPDMPFELEEKWKVVTSKNLNGGISDMALLHLFAREHSVINLLKIKDSSVYDDNISTAENYLDKEYRMKDGRKEIEWKNKQPFGFNNILNNSVKFNALHFQGSGKNFIPEFYLQRMGWLKAKRIKWDIKLLRILNKFQKKGIH